MSERPMRVPGPDHPIAVEPNRTRIVVALGGRVIADTRAALVLREADYPAVQYIPRQDVDMSALERSAHRTYCPFKGDCAYYSIAVDGQRAENAVWSYETPHAAVAAIKDHLAFYPDRVEMTETTELR
ncbi:MAG TPA: hypothetical protein DD670_01640 [Planctomycetaceae bacterium]|nr:hypothetical protein [Planctomycetaceae bacterium]